MTNEQKRRRFQFEGATPEALAKALLRPVQPPKEPEKRVSVQLGEDEASPDDLDTGRSEHTKKSPDGDSGSAIK